MGSEGEMCMIVVIIIGAIFAIPFMCGATGIQLICTFSALLIPLGLCCPCMGATSATGWCCGASSR